MIIGGKEVEAINIIDDNGMLLATINDENIIERDNILVEFAQEKYVRYKIETTEDGGYAVRIRHDTPLNDVITKDRLLGYQMPTRTEMRKPLIKDI